MNHITESDDRVYWIAIWW